ncbi:MAG TPA: hypothetical protein VFB99_18605 [Vicinamibacterales bacterium]|jgi:hypothetical protein|nr:hypothetical protein [Vicinamibacterales bacterium]
MPVTSRFSLALLGCVSITLLSAANPRTSAQTLGEPEDFTAIAIVNNNLASGAGTVLIHISRWSTDMERTRLIETLQKKGPDQLLDELEDMQSVGTIRTPDTLAYDLRYAHQQPGADGGRQIVLATDRPIGFWEAVHRPRTIQYPFTVIQMQMGTDGKGKGTLSIATKIVAHKNVVELENFATQPVMLTEITSKKAKN